jgi:hypothetical protein
MKGATMEERKERNLLPGRAPKGSTPELFYAGKCPCCGDTYLRNKTASQCQKKGKHKERDYGDKVLTLDRQALSDKGERCVGVGWKKAA